jgi:hypothetical protein
MVYFNLRKINNNQYRKSTPGHEINMIRITGSYGNHTGKNTQLQFLHT